MSSCRSVKYDPSVIAWLQKPPVFQVDWNSDQLKIIHSQYYIFIRGACSTGIYKSLAVSLDMGILTYCICPSPKEELAPIGLTTSFEKVYPPKTNDCLLKKSVSPFLLKSSLFRVDGPFIFLGVILFINSH